MKTSAHWPESAERLFTAEQINQAWNELSDRVRTFLEQRRQPRGLVALAVMNGGLFPAAELTRRLDVPMELDYVHATRYRDRTQGGQIDWQHWPARDFRDRHVLLIDDIFDEGHTLAAITERLMQQTSHVTSIVLARKQHQRGLPREWVDFHALEVPDRFVFGCGMDYLGHWRQLDSIWALAEEES